MTGKPSRTFRAADPPAAPSAVHLFLIFARIGLTSFGGGLSGWFLREFVHDRGWLTEEEFLNGLALSQTLPGVNVKNMAIWIGYKLLGLRGAVAGFCGVIVPPAIVVVLLGLGFARIRDIAAVHVAVDGAAAAAIGLTLSLGLSAARRVRRGLIPLAILAVTFLAVGVARLPLIWVVLLAGGFSVGVEYFRLGRDVR